MRMQTRRIILQLVALMGVATLMSCLSPALPVTAATKTINPNKTTDYLLNPGIGWQYMNSSNKSILGETVAYPDRHEISWKVLNPSEGSYAWGILDGKINAATSAGKQISFRIYTMRGEGFGGHQIPQWVVDKGVLFYGNGEPDYSDCNYQQYWGQFVQALRSRYDGNANIAFIDISGYGNFNEWSWQDVQTDWDDDPYNPTTVDGQARKRLADMYIGGSDSSHTCKKHSGGTQNTNYSYPGFSSTQLVMPYAGIRQSTYYVDSRRSDVGFRHDCLGRTSSTASQMQSRLGTVLNDLWRTAPVVYELCDINWGSQAFLDRAEDLLQYSHGSVVHDNPNGSPINESAAKGLMNYVGYRYYLKQATVPTTILTGTKFDISMTWQNVGYAPNYPKMGQNFKVYIYLLNTDNREVAAWEVSSAVHTWMPAHSLPGTPPDNSFAKSVNLPDLSAGTYTFATNMIEGRTGATVALSFDGAFSGTNSGGAAEQYYFLSEVAVTSESNDGQEQSGEDQVDDAEDGEADTSDEDAQNAEKSKNNDEEEMQEGKIIETIHDLFGIGDNGIEGEVIHSFAERVWLIPIIACPASILLTGLAGGIVFFYLKTRRKKRDS